MTNVIEDAIAAIDLLLDYANKDSICGVRDQAETALAALREHMAAQGWQPIETAPKYPLGGIGYSGPHFIALDPEWGAIEAWFEYPHPGSIAYAENQPPKIQFVAPYGRIGWVTLNPSHWMPLPPAPQPTAKPQGK